MSGEELHASVPLLVRRVVNRLGRPWGINPFPRAFEYDLAAADDSAHAFDAIYHENRWGSDESRSGVGSELAATVEYRAHLSALITTRGWTRLFDAPCGDLRWMPDVLARTTIAYEGGDISPALIEGLTQRHPALKLLVFNICRDPFPRADVWHCRDCLFHLPFGDIFAALRNFIASDIPYALLTTHRARWLHRNLNLRGVGFRFLDLERAPFFLPRPLAYLPDYKRGHDFPRYVGLWSREQVHQALVRAGEASRG